MKRPLIAVNGTLERTPGAQPRVSVHQSYLDAILEAGGLPLLVPPREDLAQEYFKRADGVLFTGGLDYPPKLYGEKPHETIQEQTPERTKADLKLMRLALASPKPSLGICAGLQLCNIAAGGALIQHLPTAEAHTRKAEEDSAHAVELGKGSLLAELFGAGTIQVNSSHHQAADPKRIGKGLRITARATDGTIEGIEKMRPGGRFFLCVQWHPERILNPAHRRKIFKAFINSCSGRSIFHD